MLKSRAFCRRWFGGPTLLLFPSLENQSGSGNIIVRSRTGAILFETHLEKKATK
jgi:hypothetical protein